MKRFAIGCLSIISVLVLVCSGIVLRPSLARRALPYGATKIKEHYHDARFGSDFVRCLKAKIDKDDFDTYATALKLTETYDPTRHADLRMNWDVCDEPWWDPPDHLEDTRFQLTNREDFYAIAAWHDGYVYFVVFSW